METNKSTIKNKILKVVGTLLVLIGTNITTYYVSSDGSYSPEIQSLIDTLMPTVVGVGMGAFTVLIKQGSFDKLFQKMLNDGSQTFISTAAQVTTVVKESTETRKNVKELTNAFREIEPKLDKALKIEDTLNRVEKKLDIFFNNDPRLVKSGVSEIIAKVDTDES